MRPNHLNILEKLKTLDFLQFATTKNAKCVTTVFDKQNTIVHNFYAIIGNLTMYQITLF